MPPITLKQKNVAEQRKAHADTLHKLQDNLADLQEQSDREQAQLDALARWEPVLQGKLLLSLSAEIKKKEETLQKLLQRTTAAQEEYASFMELYMKQTLPKVQAKPTYKPRTYVSLQGLAKEPIDTDMSRYALNFINEFITRKEQTTESDARDLVLFGSDLNEQEMIPPGLCTFVEALSVDSESQLKLKGSKELSDFPYVPPVQRFQTQPYTFFQPSQQLDCFPNMPDYMLKPHQLRIVQAIQNVRGMLTIHDVGTGKTRIAVTAAMCYLMKNPNHEVYVITPLSTKEQMKEKFEEYCKYMCSKLGIDSRFFSKIKFFTFRGFFLLVDGAEKAFSAMKQTSSSVLTTDQSKRLQHCCKNRMLIIDEAHNLRNESGESVISESQENMEQRRKVVDVVKRCAARADKVLLLTATPIINTISDVVTMMSFINPMLSAYNYNAEKYQDVDAWTPDMMRNIFGCQVSFYSPAPEEYKANFPVRKVSYVFIPMTPAYLKQYENIEQLQVQNLMQDVQDKFKKSVRKNNKEEVRVQKNLTVFRNGIRTATLNLFTGEDYQSSPKLNYIIRALQSIFSTVQTADQPRKVLLFSSWAAQGINVLEKVIKQLFKAMNIQHGVRKITGEVKEGERKSIIKAYNNGEVRVLLISKAGSEGIDLKETSDIFVMDPAWNESQIEQSIGRGARYRSHANPDVTKRVVNVYRLYLAKPREMTAIEQALTNVNYIRIPLSVDNNLYDVVQLTQDQFKTYLVPQEENLSRSVGTNSSDMYLLFYSYDKQANIEKFLEMLRSVRAETEACNSLLFPQNSFDEGSLITTRPIVTLPASVLPNAVGRLTYSSN